MKKVISFCRRYWISIAAVLIYYLLSYLYFGKAGLQTSLLIATSSVIVITILLLGLREILRKIYVKTSLQDIDRINKRIASLNKKIRVYCCDLYILSAMERKEEDVLLAIEKWINSCPEGSAECKVNLGCPNCNKECGWLNLIPERIKVLEEEFEKEN